MGWSIGVLAVVVAWIALPIVTAEPGGSSGQTLNQEGFPLEVSATGDDGRTRTLQAEVEGAPGRDLSSLTVGDRIIVSGSGYDGNSGIYVAVCKVPDAADQRPGPCLGGVPSTEVDGDETEGVVEYAASNWINDEWAWRLFGARSFDDPRSGTFTAYIEIQSASDENVDCTAVACGLYSRNDHTDLENRVQDLYLPVGFSE